jgi:hypothetical protein
VTASKKSIPSSVQALTTALDEALALLKKLSYAREPVGIGNDSPASLLAQCLDLCAQHEAVISPEPIRTIHHFACTGGTLISKCIAAMPNTQLLSEVNPLSAQAFAAKQKFFPTDLPRLVAASSRGADQALLLEIFLSGMQVLYEDALRNGLRLIMRDHAHSLFCFGPFNPGTPSLREALSGRFPLRSIVTVRHPLDSYLSLMNNGWQHFHPWSLNEYAVRYLAFLDHYSDFVLYKYEDFIEAPDDCLQSMCCRLEIPFTSLYKDTFSVFALSGDSGRSGNVIGRREHRNTPEPIQNEAESSERWIQLCERLGYSNVF